MPAQKLKTAQEALEAGKATTDGRVVGVRSAFVCPYADCGAYADHYWGNAESLVVRITPASGTPRDASGPVISAARCVSCEREVVFVGRTLVHPAVSEAPAPATDMPEEITADYNEAAAIARLSPRGAAALLRLAIQKLGPLLGATKSNIDAAIGELVASGKINPTIQQALDSVRVIGNEAVHPGELDLKDDTVTVTKLFSLVNFIVEKGITEPKQIAAIFGALPSAKLAGIASRDAPKAC